VTIAGTVSLALALSLSLSRSLSLSLSLRSGPVTMCALLAKVVEALAEARV